MLRANLLGFIIVCMLGYSGVCHGQSSEDRSYWIEKYLSVSYPLNSIKMTSSYGYRKDPYTGERAFHGGIDLKARFENVYSMFDGVVKDVGKDSRSGVYITMSYGDYEVSYCHLSKIAIEKGDSVLAGDIVGISGTTGRSTGPHLHLSARLRGESVNPYTLILYVQDIRKQCFLSLGGNIAAVSPESFVELYAPIAMEQQKKYGIPSSVTLSQMAYESAWGQSDLARQGNNFFGIKASRAWLIEGKPYSLHDDDKRNEAFCNYNTVRESVEHHSRLLMSDRYKRCHRYAQTDYHNWLVGIKKAGYATAKNYVKSCERIIRHHRLYLYDHLVANTL